MASEFQAVSANRQIDTRSLKVGMLHADGRFEVIERAFDQINRWLWAEFREGVDLQWAALVDDASPDWTALQTALPYLPDGSIWKLPPTVYAVFVRKGAS